MYVEFIGLPGSGKTTLRRRLLNGFEGEPRQRVLSAEHAYLIASREKFESILRLPLKLLPQRAALGLCMRLSYRSVRQAEAKTEFIAKYGDALVAFLSSEACLGMSDTDKINVIGSFLVSGAFWQFQDIPQLADKVVLYEEGLVQKSFMFVDPMHSTPEDAPLLKKYLESIPKPDMVIYVRASIDESASRMASRPDGLTNRLKNADEDTIRRFLETAQVHLDLVSDWLAERHPDSLVVIENHDDAPDMLAQVGSRITSL